MDKVHYRQQIYPQGFKFENLKNKKTTGRIGLRNIGAPKNEEKLNQEKPLKRIESDLMFLDPNKRKVPLHKVAYLNGPNTAVTMLELATMQKNDVRLEQTQKGVYKQPLIDRLTKTRQQTLKYNKSGDKIKKSSIGSYY